MCYLSNRSSCFCLCAGPSLLNAKTMMGLTAFDLAKTEEMRQVLTRGSADLNVSQGENTLCSQ